MSATSFFVIGVFVLSGIYVHYRGIARLGFFRQLTDHSTFMAPINCVMYLFSGVPNKPFIDVVAFPELKLFRDNWEVIREEAQNLYAEGYVNKSDKLDDIAFNSFFKTGWKRFYLKWYKGKYFQSAEQLCPKTVKLVKQCPIVKAAMFVVLPPGACLVRHRDPYAGSLRYHLGLSTPNSDACYIEVDGQQYYWRDGEDVLFDETFLHYAQNNTDQDRLIFFCDIERPMNNVIAQWFNRIVGRFVITLASAKNVEGEKVGFLNQAFFYLYQIRLVGKWLKSKNKTFYYFIKYLLFGGIFYLIFF